MFAIFGSFLDHFAAAERAEAQQRQALQDLIARFAPTSSQILGIPQIKRA